jgi:hypothetical protein
MSNEEIQDRLSQLESLVEEQAERIDRQQETIERQRERIADLETADSPRAVADGGDVKVIGEITADNATGVLGKATGSGTTYGVKGEVTDTSGYGLRTPNDASIDGVAELGGLGGALTGGTTITDLTGERLSVTSGVLTADNPSVAAGGSELYADADRINFGEGLTVTDNGSGQITVEVENSSPTADFNVSNELVEGQKTSFDASPSSDGDGTIVEYEWQVNGSVVGGDSKTLKYNHTPGGDYTVTLTVTDNFGAEDSVSKTVTAYEDSDGDLYGDPSPSDPEAPAGTDCDDTDPDTYPGAEEIADGKDNDCDGEVDEGT